MKSHTADSSGRVRFQYGVLLAALLGWLGTAPAANGYVLWFTNATWSLGQIKFSLLLGPAGRTLHDGNTTWDQIAIEAANLWNAELTPVRLTPMPSAGVAGRSDKKNQVFWSSSVYGMSFNGALAVALVWRSGNKITEADIVVDDTFRWDSYRDRISNHVNPLEANPRLRVTNDLQRVLVHEFGHTLGLSHPDQASPPQSVQAIMNSVIQDLNQPAADDIAGVQTLFPPELTRPSVAITAPLSGARVLLPDITVTGTASDNALVERVRYQLSGGAFQDTLTTNVAGTINWSAMVSLAPGTNTFGAKSVDTSTNESTVVSRRFFYVISNALTLQTNGAGVISPNLDGLGLELGRGYTITALPSPGNIFSNWNVGLTSSVARLSFLMQSNLILQANFVTNPFLALKGAFTGLFRETNTAHHQSSGSFTLKVTDKGSYSGRLLLAGRSHSFSGRFDLDGRATNSIVRGTNTGLNLEMVLDLQPGGTERITGVVRDGIWTAGLLANRSVFNAIGNPAPWPGLYTLIVPGTNDPSAGPEGDGYGAVKVEATGNVTLSGKLADGATLSQRATLSKNGEWPFYASLYSGKGSLCSWVQFDTNHPAAGPSGLLSWFKPTATKGLYAAGFTNQTTLGASSYSRPITKTNRVAAITNGVVTMSGGELSSAVTNHITMNLDNKVTSTNTGFTFSFTLSSGLFKGSFLDPVTSRRNSFTGALLQNTNSGSGYFAGTNHSGKVLLLAAP